VNVYPQPVDVQKRERRVKDVIPAGKIMPLPGPVAWVSRWLCRYPANRGSSTHLESLCTVVVRAQASIILNKGIFLHPKMGGDRTDFIFRHPYETGPTATGRAALAEIGGRHSRKNELWIMNYEELNLFLSS